MADIKTRDVVKGTIKKIDKAAIAADRMRSAYVQTKEKAEHMYCSNCGALLYGYRNDEGKIKYECKRCGTVAVRVQKGRRHDKIDLYAPEGQIRYY